MHIGGLSQESRLEHNIEIALYRVLQEALTNVAKHANPTNVWVDLECSKEDVKIRIRDDGRGFAISGLRGHGIGIMNERTAMAGATLDINSAPGKGTEVVVAYSRGMEQEVS